MQRSNHFEVLREIVPNFNDPKAVSREYVDHDSKELQKIEIFYGGKYGGDSEGHGHWVAEKIDGLFQVTLDRNPDIVDGGKHLIESNHRSDAFNEEARQDRILSKELIIAELNKIDPLASSLGNRVKELRNKLYNCGSCGYEENKRLKEKFESIADSLFLERNRIRESYRQQKENIIRQAENLSYSTDFKNAKQQMKALQDQWKQIPRASKEDEDILWAQFKQASDRLYDNAKKDFEEFKRKQQEAKQKKEALVRQAENLSYSTDFKNAKQQMKALQDQWKQIPRASKEDEDILWAQFKQASDRLYDNAKKDFEVREFRQQEAKEKKELIISQIENLMYTNDFKNSSLELKRLSAEFYSIGSAGKENQSLKNRFDIAKDKFYALKKQFNEIKHQEFLQRLQESIYRKQETINRLDRIIYNKKEQLSNLLSRPEPSQNNPNRWEIAKKRLEKESNLNSAITELQMKRMNIINEIAELQNKLKNES